MAKMIIVEACGNCPNIKYPGGKPDCTISKMYHGIVDEATIWKYCPLPDIPKTLKDKGD